MDGRLGFHGRSVLVVAASLLALSACSDDKSSGASAKDFGGRVVNIEPARFFPEGVTVDRGGNFYIGSMDMGDIYKATADGKTAGPFISAGAGGLVSVLGLYAADASQRVGGRRVGVRSRR